MTRTLLAAAAAVAIALAGCRTVVWTARTADGGRVEVVERLGRQRVVVEGVPGPSFDGVGVTGLVLADGLAYPARRGGRWHVVVDGREGPGHEGIGEIVRAPGGRHVAHAAQHGEGWCVYAERVEGAVASPGSPAPAPIDAPRKPGLERRAYGCGADGTGASYDGVFAGSLRLGSTGLVAFAAERAGRSLGVLAGREGEPCDGVAGVVISEDGAHAGWLERRGGEARAVVDLSAGPGFDDVRDLALAAGGRAAYAARRGDAWWVVSAAAMRGPFADVLAVRVAPDGAAVFAAESGGGVRVHAGEVESPSYEDVTELVVGPEGRVGYVAVASYGAAVVVDGAERGRAERAGGLVLGTAGRFAFVASDAGGERVVSDAGAEAVEGALFDTLAFARGDRWSVVARDVSTGSAVAAGEGGVRSPIDPLEIADAARRHADDPDALAGALRALAAAVLARPAP